MSYRTISGLSTSAVLVTVGAILSFAVTAEVQGFDVNAAGAILMIVGFVVGLGALLWGMTMDMPRRSRVVESRPVEPTPVAARPVATEQPVQRVVSETRVVER